MGHKELTRPSFNIEGPSANGPWPMAHGPCKNNFTSVDAAPFRQIGWGLILKGQFLNIFNAERLLGSNYSLLTIPEITMTKIDVEIHQIPLQSPRCAGNVPTQGELAGA